VDTRLCEQKRRGKVIPIGVPREVEQLQPIPGCSEDVAGERRTGVGTFLDDTTLAVFDPHPGGGEVAATIGKPEGNKGHDRPLRLDPHDDGRVSLPGDP
jgi:hypothetical protein